MGTKRPATEIHPSRRSQVPSNKKRKTNPHPHRTLQPKSHPLNPAKSRIRSLQRLLAHKENLPADVRLNHERELASCRHDLAEAERAERKKDFITRYHMVRFFDRQKCTRRLKQVKKRVQDGEASGDDVHGAEVDLNYALFFPLDMAYSALYPSGSGKKRRKGEKEGEEEEEAGKERKGDADMWRLVEKCMEEGKLDALRSGKLLKGGSGSQTDDAFAGRMRRDEAAAAKKAAKAKERKKTDKVDVERDAKGAKEEEDGSDDGFFE